MIYAEALWLGTEESSTQFLASLAKLNELPAVELKAMYDDEENERPNRLLTVAGGTARISIKGPLANSDHPFLNMFMGVTGYPEIREALIQAATNPRVKNILLDVDSPGGQVAGVSDTADLISRINADLKPVVAFTDGTMASAAYWLSAGAGEIYSGKTATVGSIGIVMSHAERSKALEAAGVKVTTIRAGEFKQLANSTEPLTEAGRAQLQAMADKTYGVFLEHVAQARGKSVDLVRSTMAEGRTFIGTDAVHAGLVDQVTGFDALMSQLAIENVDRPKFINENKDLGATMTTKKALTQAEITALALGITTEAALETPTELTPEQVAEAAASAEAAAAAAVAAAGIEENTKTEAENAAAAAAAAPAVAPSAVEAVLQGQLAAANDALIAVKVELAQAKAQVAALQASTEGLAQIAKNSIGNMQVALGGSRTTLDGMTAEAVVTMHAQLATDFETRFKAGGVAATAAAEPKKAVPQKRNSLQAAHLAAAATLR